MFIGLLVSAAVYWALCRNLDPRDEMALAREEGVLDLHHIAHHLPDEPEDGGAPAVREPGLNRGLNSKKPCPRSARSAL